MYKCVAVEEVQSFVERCMRAVGADPQHSTALSQVLTEADQRGHFTHGLNRLGKSCLDVKNNPSSIEEITHIKQIDFIFNLMSLVTF